MVHVKDILRIARASIPLLILIMVGTVGFVVIERLPAAEALHLTISTITTVGYGTPAIQTDAGRMWSNGKMENHVILCGYGRVGQAVVDSLHETGEPVVVICRSGDPHESDLDRLPEKVPRIVGDATEERVLKEAGIAKARAVLIAFGHDSDTLLTTITAKSLNPKVRVIARAIHQENARKLEQIGADEVVVPELEGGRRMAGRVLPARP
jgi:voltage-gated potassium channel